MKRERATIMRRSLLLGAGGALALPLLHSLSPQAWGQSTGTFPKRIVFWWVPEGVVPDQWWPTERTGTNLSPSLAPLMPYRDQLSVIYGLNMDPEAERTNDDPDDHRDCPGGVLTGGELGPERTQGGITIPQGRSIDRVMGPALQGSALFANYVVGVNNLHSNSHEHRQVSFDRLNQGHDGVSNPETVFADLLADVGSSSGPDPAQEQARLARLRGYQKQKSVLDSVTQELGRLRCQVGTVERSKLDAHLASVRTIEQQIAALIAGGGTLPAIDVPVVTVPPGAGDSSFFTAHENFPQMIELQSRILASALAAGTTRVAVMALGPGGFSPQTYPFAPLNITKWHHDLSHDEGTWSELAKINVWYEERLAFFLGLLASIPEGDGTLLDNTLVLRFSEIAHGNHGKKNLPFLLAGMGNTFRLGQNFDAGGRPHNDVLTAILQGFGLDITALGPDAANVGPYTEILV